MLTAPLRNPEGVFGVIQVLSARVDAFTGPGPAVTDDRPSSEYFLWRRVFMDDRRYIDEPMLRAATP